MTYARVPLEPRDPHLMWYQTFAYQMVDVFLKDKVVEVSDKHWNTFAKVYDRYVDWCEETGVCRVGKPTFSMALLDTSTPRMTRGSGRVRYLGINILR